MTSRQLARQLGVSQSTISRAFSSHASIAPAMRQKVMDAALALGYQPNVIARSLSTRRSNIVDIVMASMTNPFYPDFLEQPTRALQQVGLQTLLFHPPPGEDVDSHLPLLRQYQVDALLIASATVFSARAWEWTATGRADTSTNADRERSFTERLLELGVPLHARSGGEDHGHRQGYDATLTLARYKPDAIFYANDITALGGMDALRRELGLSVPRDVAVVGFDDIPMASWPAYGLMTVQQPMSAMVEAAVACLART